MLTDPSHLISLFENATEGFVTTGPNGDIVLVNPSACRMFGYKPEEIIGQQIELLIPQEYRSGHERLRENFHKHPQNRVMGHGRDLHGLTKDGVRFPLEVSLSTYIHNNERYVTAFVVDITHRKRIEQNMLEQQRQLESVTTEMRNLNAELEEKVEERTLILKEALQHLESSQQELSEALDKERQLNEIKSRFVSMASHEFRTPLSTVLSSTILLSKYTGAEQQQQRDKHIAKIRASVKHLNDLLEDFLSLGKLDEGKVGASFDETDIKELISDTIEEMKALAKDEQVISYHHEGPQLIATDKKMLRNILINLISNAIKFSEPATEIRVHSAVGDRKTTISVEDRGIGIADEDQKHMFSSFFRGKNALNIQGTGLGLHIVKRYLELLSGSITLKSELGKGTKASITLPLKN
jgi:PAS domain S-box-containing protein